MRTPLFFSLFFSLQLFSQELPLLNDSDMVNKNEFGKKIGWYKVKLDAAFNRTDNDRLAKYECYLFSAGKDLYSWHYFKGKNKDRLAYFSSGPNPGSKLLDGIMDQYDKEGHIIYRLVFRQGFLVKEYDCRSWLRKHHQPGRVRTVIENIPGKNQVEYYASVFGKDRMINSWGHGFNTGKTFTSGPPYKELSPVMDVMNGWKRDSWETYNFFIGTDSISKSGKNSLTIRSLGKKREGVGRTFQNIDAKNFRGKRVRMSGYILSDVSAGHAEFFMSIWQGGVKDPVGYDGMY